MKFSPDKKILAAGIIVAMSQLALIRAQAADVPQGVTLAAKQEIVRGNGGEVQSLDPHKIEGSPESYVSYDLLEGLAIVNPQGKVVPAVAESWENKDGKIWTFHLRKNARWSNGEPVTAQDFVYSWRRLVDPKTASPYASYLQYGHVVNVDDIVAGKKSPDQLGVKALDDHTLQVTLTKSVPFFDQLLVYPALSPVYPPVVEKYGDQWTQPQHWVGNGAYTLQDHIVNERIVVVRNPEYWDNAATVINKVTFLPIDSEVNDVNRFYSADGSDMTFNNLPIELFRKLKKDNPQDLHVDPYLCTYFYELNNKKAPFNDARVRTAIKLGLDRDIIVNKVLAQGQTPAYSLTDPATQGIDVIQPAWYKETQAQRNDAAKKLLQEAGYGPGHPLTFTLLYNTSDLHKKLAIAAASLWKKNLGVNVVLENQEWKTYLDSRHQGTYQMARAGWCGDYNEPSAFLNTMQTGDSNNTAFYSDAAFDQALKNAANATDSHQRAGDYQQAEQILDKDSGIVPVFYYANTRLVKPYIGGYTGKDPLDHIYDKNLYIIKH
ncbi:MULTISPECIES: ABC transporter substrate-binding protein [unclassified Tatumella]|uniref:ABC transporter substrate-binding protein n=1 Tax=unclassified Tatumella TaxID=2649542 RepID=UPI001BAEFFFF|nr:MULTISPECIES: ABC transporter substrate-binding protein [unclassified Tatumella]MBS0856278.1 oligopeptide ABC transporter substrate-binding protein OppA [Tatumella sp. JGM16]MBS0876373.1 oligopeptide ABC transporter substrate-binding protein OppA [Tatumella sp. JGM82]MBS0889546.1 oligopeptide ABC transporter substrate-binding protein OppA [Tatumella sp. JGM94]MBS0900668.1 oligopeptide ABC transporter substrate-binding protein OppA [Tatumella sp. JGM100]MBS0913413.1 oligopeptide ABC transpor